MSNNDYSELVERLKGSAEDRPGDFSITEAAEAITTLQRQLAEANDQIDKLCQSDSAKDDAMLNDEKTIAAQSTQIEKLRAGINDVIGYNVQEAIDRYGDASKAESWACVRRLRAALTDGGE